MSLFSTDTWLCPAEPESAVFCHDLRFYRLPHTATDWPKCFCIYRLKCSNALSGWAVTWLDGNIRETQILRAPAVHIRHETPCYELLKDLLGPILSLLVFVTIGRSQKAFHLIVCLKLAYAVKLRLAGQKTSFSLSNALSIPCKGGPP